MQTYEGLLTDVADYYSGKIKEYGISAKGVDWNSETSQQLRFEVLLNLIKNSNNFSILDYGCGYGALVHFLKTQHDKFDYTGFDISAEMLQSASITINPSQNIHWTSQLNEQIYDYVVASGIFNVKLQHDELEWKHYIEAILSDMNAKCTRGFAFNMLTAYSDKEFRRNDLYYADPFYYFDFCKKHFSKYVALLHDYPLYEFTIIIRK